MIKTKNFFKFNLHYSHRLFVFLFIIFILLLNIFLIARAKVFAYGAEITQAYDSAEILEPGSLVSLQSEKKDSVILTNRENEDRFIGVFVADGNSAISINAKAKSVQVATNGRAVSLVTDLNGAIKKGDLLSVSAINGVASKAIKGTRIIGIAQSDFNTSDDSPVKHINDIWGNKKQIHLGSLPIVINSNEFGNGAQQLVNNGKSVGFQGWLESIAGKPISNLRIGLTGIVAIITIVSLSVMIFSSIRTSIFAVGRNPLAKSRIFEALTRVTVMVMVVGILGTTIMYAVLRI